LLIRPSRTLIWTRIRSTKNFKPGTEPYPVGSGFETYPMISNYYYDVKNKYSYAFTHNYSYFLLEIIIFKMNDIQIDALFNLLFSLLPLKFLLVYSKDLDLFNNAYQERWKDLSESNLSFDLARLSFLEIIMNKIEWNILTFNELFSCIFHKTRLIRYFKR
jgi:hypothetical protein